MSRILVYQEPAAGDEFVSRASSQFQWRRFVDVAVQDQCGCFDRSKLGAEIGFRLYLVHLREHLDRDPVQEHPAPPVYGLFRDGVFGKAEKIRCRLCRAAWKVILKRLAKLLEGLSGRAAWIVVGLQSKRRRRRNQDSTTDPVAA